MKGVGTRALFGAAVFVICVAGAGVALWMSRQAQLANSQASSAQHAVLASPSRAASADLPAPGPRTRNSDGDIDIKEGPHSRPRPSLSINPQANTVSRSPSPVPAIPGDVSGDGKVSLQDFMMLRAALGKPVGDSAGLARGDLDHDGTISKHDLADLKYLVMTTEH